MNQSKTISTLLVILAVAVTAGLYAKMQPEQENTDAEDTVVVNEPVSVVRLSDAKLSVAGIKTQAVVRQSLVLVRTLPARFTYDDTRHVSVRAATDGVLETVLVKPGDEIKSGQTVAVLRSPQVGAARSEVLSRKADHELAATDYEWNSKICAGVAQLVKAIRSGAEIQTMEQNFDAATLGKYRSELLNKYAKAALASRFARAASGVSDGAISGRIVDQRKSDQQQALSELNANVEQALFETQQECKKAQASLDQAARKLTNARQSLTTLLGMTSDANAMPDSSPNDSDLARLEVRSPLTGTVERKVHSASERVLGGSELFVIADTSSLWVEADVRGRDWGAIQVAEGVPVVITSPATGDQQVAAKIYYVGREVDPASGAIPLVAQVTNEDQQYRPGLFARMEVPTGRIDNVLVVPESAVVDLSGEASVFVEHDGGYLPVSVDIGASSRSQVEVRSGLTEMQKVVVEGAFILKSELLLEGSE
ncbi:MAG: efflux RND transporter periplasmic adaptor subunit [Rubripirellula sp.]